MIPVIGFVNQFGKALTKVSRVQSDRIQFLYGLNLDIDISNKLMDIFTKHIHICGLHWRNHYFVQDELYT